MDSRPRPETQSRGVRRQSFGADRSAQTAARILPATDEKPRSQRAPGDSRARAGDLERPVRRQRPTRPGRFQPLAGQGVAQWRHLAVDLCRRRGRGSTGRSAAVFPLAQKCVRVRAGDSLERLRHAR